MEGFSVDGRAQRVVFGAGAARSVPREVAGLGVCRVLVVSGGSALPLAKSIATDLGDLAVAEFGEVRQHVPEPLAVAVCEVAAEHRIDAVVTVGGGSAVGLGKVVAHTMSVPVVAVPTTYAGSELTDVWGMTSNGTKRIESDPRVLPRVVIYDPETTVDLPARATASTGFNALAHAVEGWYGVRSTPLTRLHALEAIRVLAAALPACVDQPADLGARARAFYGAYLAGLAFSVTGSALHHKLCHVLGGSHAVVHGEVNAVLLPYVLAFNAPAVRGLDDGVAEALGGCGDAAQALRRLARELNLPASLAELGIPKADLDLAAERATVAVGAQNPRPASPGEIRELLACAHAGLEPHSA